jgi:hypothetical protein
MGIISIYAHPLKCVVSRIVHHTPVIQTVKQTVQLFKERYTKTWWPCNNWHVYYRLVNVYQTHHQPSTTLGKDYQKIEGSVKPIRGTQCMESGLNECVQSMNVDWSVVWSGIKVARLMTCSRASDDITNIRLSQRPISCDRPRDWMRPELESRLGACLCELY